MLGRCSPPSASTDVVYSRNGARNRTSWAGGSGSLLHRPITRRSPGEPRSTRAPRIARHADIRQTAKYTHIGMRARAEVLAGLQYPKRCESIDLSEIRRVSGGVMRQEVSRVDSNGDRKSGPENEKTPSEGGFSSFLVTDFQEVSVDVGYRGGGNCTRLRRPRPGPSVSRLGFSTRPSN
jgi:hypothetical protein